MTQLDHLPEIGDQLHGHTHDACQYTHNNIRVVCNPRGYAREASSYNPDLVLDI